MKSMSLAVLVLMTYALPSLAQRPDTPQPPMLVVSGNAEILATPDEARVSLGIVRQANAAQTAQEQANAIGQQILNEIGKLGVPAQQIQTSRLVLTPIYAPRGPDSRDAPRIVAYNASDTVSVRLENLSLIGPVIDAGLKAGANQLEGVQFALRNDLPSRQQALKQAIMEARSKADVMADALRVDLTEVFEVSEGGSVTPGYDLPMNGRVFAAAEAAASQTPVSPGQIQVRANVTIRYRISRKP
jgi:hypothetical protein